MNHHEDIKAAMSFYEERGWDWLMVVAFLSAEAVGMWPPLKRKAGLK